MKGALDQKNKKTKDFLAILLKPHVFEEKNLDAFPPKKISKYLNFRALTEQQNHK